MKTTNPALSLEWRQETLFGGTLSTSLYVNGEKTNVYYFDKQDTFLGDTKTRALKIAELIKAGEIYPNKDSWHLFDICASVPYKIESLEITEDEPHWKNHLLGLSGREMTEEHKRETLERLLGSTESCQWTKMYDENLNRLNILAIKFYPYGATVFFK